MLSVAFGKNVYMSVAGHVVVNLGSSVL